LSFSSAVWRLQKKCSLNSSFKYKIKSTPDWLRVSQNEIAFRDPHSHSETTVRPLKGPCSSFSIIVAAPERN
jgi:hypothetical protein